MNTNRPRHPITTEVIGCITGCYIYTIYSPIIFIMLIVVG